MSLITILKGLHKKMNILDSKMNKLDIKMNSITKMLTTVDCGESQLKYMGNEQLTYQSFQTVMRNVNDPCVITQPFTVNSVYIDGNLVIKGEPGYPIFYYYKNKDNRYLVVDFLDTQFGTNCSISITNTKNNTTTYYGSIPS